MTFKNKPPGVAGANGTSAALGATSGIPAFSTLVFSNKKDILPNKAKQAQEKISVVSIDDELIIVRSISRILRDSEFTLANDASAITSVVAAMDLITRLKPSIVVTDLNFDRTGEFGKLGGGHLAQKIKLSFPEIKVILVSGTGNEIDARPDLRAHIDEVLGKPFSPDDLLNTMRLALFYPEKQG